MAPKQQPGRSKQDYGTPAEFLIAVRRRLGIEHFAWDLAATRGVNECSPFGCYTVEDDALGNGLGAGWLFPGWCWLNPPYSDISPWVERAYESGQAGGHIAVLVPASVGANWWVEWVEHKCTAIPLNGRITFVGETDPYPKDCALLLYGPDVLIGYDSAWKWMNTLTEEERDMAKKRTAKPGKTPKIRSIKGGKAVARAEKPNDSEVRTVGRVTTFTPNGPSSMQPAPEPAGIDLGPIILPDSAAALKLLGELAQLNDRALDAQARYNTLKDATKQAKEKYDDLAEQVITRLRQATHASDLPLFPDVRESDQAAMEAGPVPVVDEATGAPVSDDPTGEAEIAPTEGSFTGEMAGPDEQAF